MFEPIYADLASKFAKSVAKKTPKINLEKNEDFKNAEF
jgi:hypothetical protein